MNVDREMVNLMKSIEKLISGIFVIESYKAGLITRKEAYQRTGLRSKLEDAEEVNDGSES